MYKLFLSFIFIILLASNSFAFTTKAKQAVLIDNNSGEILFEKNASEQMTPSSMTKLMTTYIAFKHLKKGILNLDDTFTISEKAWRKGGSKMFVKHTDKVSIDELLHGIIVQSGNDASIAIAEGISSSEEDFASLMNQTAEEIGLENSSFKNSTGWPDENHYMSAKDIAVLSEKLISEFPELYKMFAKKEYSYNGINQPNRNLLLGSDIGADGLKTGHTEDGGYGLAASAKRQDRRLIAVVNGLDNTFDRTNEARRLLKYGFRYFENKNLFKAGQTVTTAKVWQGTSNEVELATDEDITISVPKISDEKVTIKAQYNNIIYAPIKEGDHLGNLVIEIPKIGTREIPLYATRNIDKSEGISGFIQKVKFILANK